MILAWLDQRIIVETNNGTASKIAFNLIDQIATDIKAAGFTIAHLKFLVDDGIKKQKISATTTGNLNDHSLSATQGVDKVEILINARIEADPSALDELVCSCLQGVCMETGCRIEEVKKSFFRPGYPRPTHRIV